MPDPVPRQTVLDPNNSTKQLRKVVNHIFNWLIFPIRITFIDIVRILHLFFRLFWD
jgi:hypothetical protein